MFVYLDITATPPEDIFAGNCCMAIVRDTQVSPGTLAACSADDLATLGLARAPMVIPEYNPATHALSGQRIAKLGGDGWVSEAVVRPLSQEELDQMAANAARLACEEAAAELKRSDVTGMRCYEVGMPLPPEWVTYRQDLRAIVAGGPGPMPVRPPYPAGT